jgi:histidinol dehydrogenase
MPRYLKKVADQVVTNGKASQPSNIVQTTEAGIIDDIRANGDAAVRKYSEKFDKWSPKSFKLSSTEIESIIAQVPEQTIKDIKEVQANVRKFAEAQKDSLKDFELEIQPGVFLGQRNLPINRVGAYVEDESVSDKRHG